MIWTSLILITSYFTDLVLGEPTRYHPLVGFGNCANKIELYLNKPNKIISDKVFQLLFGSIAWMILVLPIPLLLLYFEKFVLPEKFILFIDCVIVYWALGHNSLKKHGLQIYHALKAKNLALAQHYCGFIVSRDTTELTEKEICRATVESMLENGHDAITATLICYIIGGAPLVVIHRIANTLDAMWGYRNARFNYFGKFSARADDLLGFISAKTTALLFALLGLSKAKFWKILTNSFVQAREYKSHNGGCVMAAGATLLNVKLGGVSSYHGKVVASPLLGCGEQVNKEHINLSLKQINQAVWLLFAVVFIGNLTQFL